MLNDTANKPTAAKPTADKAAKADKAKADKAAKAAAAAKRESEAKAKREAKAAAEAAKLAAKPTEADKLAARTGTRLSRDAATVAAGKYPFNAETERDGAYRALYADAAKRTNGKPFTLADILAVSAAGRNPHYNGSAKATDAGALIRAVKAGFIARNADGSFSLKAKA